MAKTIKSKVEYQVTELTTNLNKAATATSEQKRDFFTTRALYNAKRLTTIINRAKVGAMAIAIAFTIASCGSNNTVAVNADSTSAKVDSTSLVQPVDSAK